MTASTKAAPSSPPGGFPTVGNLKALSLWQPWASLVAAGHKRIETRHWSTPYRGLLAIHAAQRKPTAADLAFADGVRLPDPLPLGAVVCLVRLVDIVKSEALVARPGFTISPEYIYGNYQPGRFGWVLELVEVFDPAIPARGAQGLWNWTPPAAASGITHRNAALTVNVDSEPPESSADRDGQDRAPGAPRAQAGHMAERGEAVNVGQYW